MDATQTVERLMTAFAERTGLADRSRPPCRYLWTDAFAVCNFLELHRLQGDDVHMRNALALVDQVHDTLGRHREGHPTGGWISGLSEAEGRRHPTCAGLRIGKKLDQRGPNEPADDRLEWDRDGQYFHYLTKWMHALDQVTRATGEPRYNRWAVELATAAHAGFCYAPAGGGPKRMVWKMSIELAYPLVRSMGQHDPLDGLITFEQLKATAEGLGDAASAAALAEPITDMDAICRRGHWVTDDALGLGGLLSEACRLSQLGYGRATHASRYLGRMLNDAEAGMGAMASPFHLPQAYRLAFRELGLAIGLHGVDRMRAVAERQGRPPPHALADAATLSRLAAHASLSERIERFWLDPLQQRSSGWLEHLDINSVMLATSLAPDGYLVLR